MQLSDPAYLGVFYYALRDTLYVHDIDSATRVGLGGVQRFRVVTNKGEIVDPSGTLTGGGGRTYGGKMGRKVILSIIYLILPTKEMFNVFFNFMI